MAPQREGDTEEYVMMVTRDFCVTFFDESNVPDQPARRRRPKICVPLNYGLPFSLEAFLCAWCCSQ